MTFGSITRRSAAVAIVSLALTGCKSWHPTTVSPRQVLRTENPRTVRITDIDGSVVTVRHPMIRNDSIVTSDTNPLGAPVIALGVPSSDVNVLEVERFDGKKTVIATAIGVGATALWASWARSSAGGSEQREPSEPKLQISVLEAFRFLGALVR